jgi:hypothetical protein
MQPRIEGASCNTQGIVNGFEGCDLRLIDVSRGAGRDSC